MKAVLSLRFIAIKIQKSLKPLAWLDATRILLLRNCWDNASKELIEKYEKMGKKFKLTIYKLKTIKTSKRDEMLRNYYYASKIKHQAAFLKWRKQEEMGNSELVAVKMPVFHYKPKKDVMIRMISKFIE